MNEFNTWAKDQQRTPKQTFAPKWTAETVQQIMAWLNDMVPVDEIQFTLMKEYRVSWATASNWVEMARNVMKDMHNGLTLEQALERDKERRNMLRRKDKPAE